MIHKTFVFILVLGFNTNLFGQSNDSTEAPSAIIPVAENLPSFPGGSAELLNFVQKQLNYPLKAIKKGIQGIVVISFVVERDGSINHESIKIEESIHPLLDEEAIRIVKLMPAWIPASHDGRKVRYKTGFPVNFQL